MGKQHDHLHSTRLKNRILAHFPDVTAHKEGGGGGVIVLLDLGEALRRSFDHDYDDDEAIRLARAANIVRRDMLKMQASFVGSFDLDCQVRSMPRSLSAMVAMILNGPNFKSQECDSVSQASISIAQLLQYHISVRRPRETPLPIYVGLVVHARTRKRDLMSRHFKQQISPYIWTVLTKLAPWFFSLDHINCARWVPVHIRYMVNLNKDHPQIVSEFAMKTLPFARRDGYFRPKLSQERFPQDPPAYSGYRCGRFSCSSSSQA